MRGSLILTAVLVFMLPAVAAEMATSDASLRVTTDSAEYCESLSGRLPPEDRLPVPARNLAQEGLRLCATGHIRTGIAKLRRALRVSQQQDVRASAD